MSGLTPRHLLLMPADRPLQKPTQPEFARRFRTARLGLGLTGTELGARLAINRATIYKYEDPGYKDGPASEPRRRAIEERLGLPAGYFDRELAVDFAVLRAKADATQGEARRRAALDGLAHPDLEALPLWGDVLRGLEGRGLTVTPAGDSARDRVIATYRQALAGLVGSADVGSVPLSVAVDMLTALGVAVLKELPESGTVASRARRPRKP